MTRPCTRCKENFMDDNPNCDLCDDCLCDLNDDPDEEPREPDYYECFGCGYSCVERPWAGGQCPRCTAHMEEGYF